MRRSYSVTTNPDATWLESSRGDPVDSFVELAEGAAKGSGAGRIARAEDGKAATDEASVAAGEEDG